MLSSGYQRFIVSNRERINRYLNRALWFFIITGPALAIGVAAGIFPDTDYSTCLIITILVAALAAVHLILVKRIPNSMVTSVFALAALDAILYFMEVGHVNVHLLWF